MCDGVTCTVWLNGMVNRKQSDDQLYEMLVMFLKKRVKETQKILTATLV